MQKPVLRTEAEAEPGVVPINAPNEGALYRLGGAVPLDGRISWAPRLPGRFQPINCYVALESENAFLIDTGVAVHRAEIVRQLKSVLPRHLPLTVSMTRAEFECAGNIGAVHTAVPIEQIIAGGMRNPFDAYDDVSRSVNVPTKRQRLESVTSAINPLGPSKRLLLIPSRLRILTTYWLYDKSTRTLFTSDSFGHTSTASADAMPIIDENSDDDTTADLVKLHLLAKYSWLPIAQTGEITKWLTKIFTDFDVENIAPTHGCILKGKKVVDRHLGLLLDVLENVGQRPN